MEVLAAYPDTVSLHGLLKRLFDEQYIVEDGKAVLRDKKSIKADSLQNPNDPDASYRDKHGQKVQGYVTNITETVEEGKPSIITSVQVETAVFADCHFLKDAVENSEKVTNSTIEDLYADGAYQSPENREFAKGHNDMQLKTGRMQGGCRWELIPHDEDGLTVREIATGNTFEAVKARTRERENAGAYHGITRPAGGISRTRTSRPTYSGSRLRAFRQRSNTSATTSRLPCSSTVSTLATARPDTGACASTVSMLSADACG